MTTTEALSLKTAWSNKRIVKDLGRVSARTGGEGRAMLLVLVKVTMKK